jgi:uncharacterized protein HemX
MPATDSPPAGERTDPGGAPEERPAKRSPWLWATIGVAVIAIALGAWGLHERSKANDATADLQAQQEQAIPPATTTKAETQTAVPTTSTTETDGNDVGAAALAAAAAAFAAGSKALNQSQDQVDELEGEVDKANAEADQAEQDAEKAKEQADSATKSEKPKAEADEADARERQLRAKADAAAACAKAMLEIVGDIPSAASLDEGLTQAAGEVKALVPKCKDAVAAAGN